MDNPYLAIIGHPTGRLLLSRDPYPIDMDAVLEKAAQDRRRHRDQRRPAPAGPRLAPAAPGAATWAWRSRIGADAHNLAGIRNVEFGVGIARKGWLTRDDVLNARPVEDFWRMSRLGGSAARRHERRTARRLRRLGGPKKPRKDGRAAEPPRAPSRRAREILRPPQGGSTPTPPAPWSTRRLPAARRHHPLRAVHRCAGQPGHPGAVRRSIPMRGAWPGPGSPMWSS